MRSAGSALGANEVTNDLLGSPPFTESECISISKNNSFILLGINIHRCGISVWKFRHGKWNILMLGRD